MDRTTKEKNQAFTSVKTKDFSETAHSGMSLGGDNIMAMNGAPIYSTISQAELKDTTTDEPVDDGDRKKIREKTRKDRIRQGIHKLSELLPDEFHSREGQKETLVSILEKAAEFMSSMKKPGDSDHDISDDQIHQHKTDLSADKLNADVLNDLKDGLESLKDKDLGSEMEAALSLMAGTVADHESLQSTNPKLGNNNTLEMVSNENHDTNINMGTTIQNTSTDNKNLLQQNSSMNLQGLGDHSFIASMGSGMFGDGPLLPSLMSPMLPGTGIGGMLGSFPSINPNLIQNNPGMGGVSSSSSQTGAQSQTNFSGFSQDNNPLFMSPSSVNTGTPGGNSTISNQSLSLLDSSSIQGGNSSSHPSHAMDTSHSIQMKTEPHDSGSTVNMHFNNNNSLQPAQNTVNFTLQDNKNAVSVANTMQNSTVNSNLVNSSVVFSSANNLSLNPNMTINTNNMSGTSVGNSFLGGISVPSSINMGTTQTNPAIGNIQNHLNVTLTSNTAVPSNVAAAPIQQQQQQKGIANIINQNLPFIGQQQIGALPQTVQQNIVMPTQMPGTTVGPLQGTLVLHNNQLILVPNNQQQMVNSLNSGLTINQNIPGNIANQGAFHTQTGMIGNGALQGISGGTSVHNLMNAGIQNVITNQIAGVQGTGMQNVVNISAQQAQAVQQKPGNPNLINATQRFAFNQPHILGAQGGIIQPANQGAVIQQQQQQQPGINGGQSLVNINTPGGVVQMNTAPSAPNQLPSALILPNGQIVPVVTQANNINQPQQTVIQQPGGNVIIQGNQIAASQAGGQLTIQTPGSQLGINQVISGGTGLLMTTAMTQGIKSQSITTVASTGFRTTHSQFQQIGPNMAMFPTGVGGVIKGPLVMASKSHQSHKSIGIMSKPSSSGTKSTSSSKSKSKSSKKLVTNLPTTVQAMLTPEGNIILSLPPGVATSGAVLTKPLTPGSAQAANSGKLPLNKKLGQRIIMPKPTSGAPVATIAPLLPGQPSNIIVSSIATPAIPTACFTKGSGIPQGVGGQPHLSSGNFGNITQSNNRPLQHPSVAVSGSMAQAPMGVGIGHVGNLGAAPAVCSQSATIPPPVSLSTDILAKAAESIFQESIGGAMSPGFYNHANDDNPLQIVDTNDVNHLQQQSENHALINTQSLQKHSVISRDSSQLNTLPILSQTKGDNGVKPKIPKSKEGKPAKPKKKSSKESKAAKATALKVKNENLSQGSISTNELIINQHDFSANPTGELPPNFPIASEHFMTDLADSLDDGDNESDINDFSDLIRMHEPKPKPDSIPPIARVQNLAETFARVISSPEGSISSLPPSLHTPTDSIENVKAPVSEPSHETQESLTEMEKLLGVTSSHTPASLCLNEVTPNLPSLPISASDLVSSWINTNAVTSPLTSTNTDASYTNCVTNTSQISTQTSNSMTVSNTTSCSSNGISVSVHSTLVSSVPSLVSHENQIVSSEPVVVSTTASVFGYPNTMSSSKDTTTISNSSSSNIFSVIPESFLNVNTTTSDESVPPAANDLMGLTPMEIIQSIAENAGKNKQEKSPKESKDPSPRISQKKLAKAGKGPPAGNLFYNPIIEPSKTSEISKSPSRSDSTKSPKKSEVAKSPKRELAKSPKRESMKSPKRLDSSKSTKQSDQLKSPKRSDQSKSPKRSEQSKSPKRVVNEETISDLKDENIWNISDNNALIVKQKSTDEPLVAKKSESKSTLSKKQSKKPTQKKDFGKDNQGCISSEQSRPQDLSVNSLTVSKEDTVKVKETKKQRTKSKDKNQHSRLHSQDKDKKITDKIDTDEPPKLEREEPFLPISKDQKDGYSQVKHDRKLDENIFMNAIISEKQDFFGGGSSLFAQSAISAIPPFTNASLPPPPFGFGAPPFFRFPMINTTSGLAPSFQHHMPLFAQPPPLFANSFGEVPFKFPDHPGMSPRGMSGFGGSNDMGGAGVQRNRSQETRAEENVSKSKPSDYEKSSKSIDSSSSGKHKKKTKKDKRREREKCSKETVTNDTVGTFDNSSLSVKVTQNDMASDMFTTTGFEGYKEERVGVSSSPRRPIINEPQSEATSIIDVVAASSEFGPLPDSSSIFPDKMSELSEKSNGKRKKDKKKKKDRRKKDKSESEYEFEIVQHSIVPEEHETFNKSEIVTETTDPVTDSTAEAYIDPVQDSIDISQVESSTEVKSRKSRSRTRKRGNKIEIVEARSDENPPDIFPPVDTIVQETCTDDLGLDNSIDSTPTKDRKIYSLRGRGLSPKGRTGEISELDVSDAGETIDKEHNNLDFPDEEDLSVMVKISPLKQSPKKVEIDEVVSKTIKGSKRRGGRTKSQKQKEDLNLSEKLPDSQHKIVDPDFQRESYESASPVIKGSNKIQNDKASEETLSVETSSLEEISTSAAGKILKTSRAERKSDYSPPKVNKFGADIAGAGKRGKRGPSPLKKLPKGGKPTAKISAILPTPSKSGPFDVFDFEDEPVDKLPTTLKSFNTLSKEQKSGSIDQSSASDLDAQPESPVKQPSIKLKLSTASNKDKKAKAPKNELIKLHPELNRTMSTEMEDPEMSINNSKHTDSEHKEKKMKKTSKTRKRAKKDKESEESTDFEISTASSVPESTDSELNLSQEYINEPQEISKKSKGKCGRKSKKGQSGKAETLDEESVSTNTQHLNKELQSTESIANSQRCIGSLSENEGYKSDKESKSKEHIGLEKTIKALHERLNSTSPIRLPPPILPGFEDLPEVPSVKEKKSKSRKRGRENSQSDSHALDLSVPDANEDDSEAVSAKLVVSKPLLNVNIHEKTIQPSKFVSHNEKQAERSNFSQVTAGESNVGANIVQKLSTSQIGTKELCKDTENNLKAKDISVKDTHINHSENNLIERPYQSMAANSYQKTSKSKKRSKDEASLDQRHSFEHQSVSQPTPAKVKKANDQKDIFLGPVEDTPHYTSVDSLKLSSSNPPSDKNLFVLNANTSSDITTPKNNNTTQENLTPPKNDFKCTSNIDIGAVKNKEPKKSRKRSHSSKTKSPKNTDDKNASGVVLETGAIPETITFSENDLFDVLDQVEQSGNIEPDNNDTRHTKPDSVPVDDVASAKRSKLDSEPLNSEVQGEKKIEINRSNTNEKTVLEEARTLGQIEASSKPSTPNTQTENTSTQVPVESVNLSQLSKPDDSSPSKKEKRRERKKRRKEKHAVREMSESELGNRGENFVIPNLHPPVPEVNVNQTEQSNNTEQQIDHNTDKNNMSDKYVSESSAQNLVSNSKGSTIVTSKCNIENTSLHFSASETVSDLDFNNCKTQDATFNSNFYSDKHITSPPENYTFNDKVLKSDEMYGNSISYTVNSNSESPTLNPYKTSSSTLLSSSSTSTTPATTSSSSIILCSNETSSVLSTSVINSASQPITTSTAALDEPKPGQGTASNVDFKVPLPITTTEPTQTLKGNPSKPLERSVPKSAEGSHSKVTDRSSTSHLVARIPKKRIDAYQKEYENATNQQSSNSFSKDDNFTVSQSNNTSSVENNKSSSDNVHQSTDKSISSLSSKIPTEEGDVFDAFGPSPAINPYGTDFPYSFGKPVVKSVYVGNPPSASSTLNFMDMDNNSITTNEEVKDSDKPTSKNSINNKYVDFDFIPPSPLSSARHSHLGSLAQVAQLRATSIVMPASPRTPVAKPRKEKQDTSKKDTAIKDSNVTSKENNEHKNLGASMGGNPIKEMENTNKNITSKDIVSNVGGSSSTMDIMSSENVGHSQEQMPPPQMPPPQMPPIVGDKPMEKEVDKMTTDDDNMPEPYSPGYTAEPLFSPPSILPPDSVHQEHELSPTMPAVVQQQEVQPPKPKEPTPSPSSMPPSMPPPPMPSANQMYSGPSYMDTTQGVDLSQRGMYSQDTSTSSTCALQQTKQQQQHQQPQLYDTFSPPYASQASSGPSPSMGSSNPGSNQMLSPNMNNSVVNTATTTSYTTSSSSSQMSGQRGGYASYYPMPPSVVSQQGPAPGPPPPLTMQPNYGMEPHPSSTPRESNMPQNRTPGMVNSDRMTSPHPSNQPKTYSSYLSAVSDTSNNQQHGQQRETQRLTHPEKESQSRRTSGGHGQMTGTVQSGVGVGNTQHSGQQQHRSRSSSVGGGRSSNMTNDGHRTPSRSNNPYYSQTTYSAAGAQMTSPPLHHRGPVPTEPSSNQRSSYDIPYSAATAAYGALAAYSTPYNTQQSLAANNSSSSHSQSLHQHNKSSSHSQQRHAASSTAKNLSSNKQPPAAHSSSHRQQPQPPTAQQQQPPQQPTMQQSVKSSSNRSSSSATKSSSKKTSSSSSSKSAYDMDQAMMSSMFDPSRSMTPYFPFPNLHSPSSRNFPEANPYFPGMFTNHQRPTSQHKNTDMNNPFMFPHSQSRNGLGFNWGGMNTAHSNHHSSTPQTAHTNSSAAHLGGFNFNLFGGAEMNSSHSAQDGLNISPIKLPHSQLLSQHGMEHNAAIQHQSFYQNRGQMPPPMLHNPMSFLGHQHPGFDSRSMGAGTMGAHFGSHAPSSFGMSFLQD